MCGMALCGCGTYASTNTINSVEKGMTTEQVKAILGTPDERRMDGGVERWEYSKLTNAFYQTYKTVKVDFVNGRVTGFAAYNEPDWPKDEVHPVPHIHSQRPVPPVSPSVPQRADEYMSDEEFNTLYNKIKSKSFDDERMELTVVGSLDSRFSCAQCRKIMSIYDFDDKKLATLRIMAPHIVDLNNAPMLIDAFTFDSSKDKAKLILSELGGRSPRRPR